MSKTLLLSLLCATNLLFAQSPPTPKGGEKTPSPLGRVGVGLATKSELRLESFKLRQELAKNSLVSNVPFRNVGPTIMGGRVVDMEVNTENPNHFFVAYASGGLWETKSNATEFTPLFDNQAVMTIGDIAVRWSSPLTPEGGISPTPTLPKGDGVQTPPSGAGGLEATEIWVGTGENNSSRSSYAGAGVYKSNDKGKTWQHLGLAETQHIGRVILHPTDKNIAWVAAIGHLYSDNAERGVFKTTDGGKTWAKTLFINEQTGIIDLVINPKNPNILYAAAWERNRKAWNFQGNGKNSGIYKSTDGGQTWAKLSSFPTTEGTGRIGIAIAPQPPKGGESGDILYAVLDNQDKRSPLTPEGGIAPPNPPQKGGLKTPPLGVGGLSSAEFLALPDSTINNYLDKNKFPQKYNATEIKEKVKSGKLKPKDLANYLGGDANNDLFDTPIKGFEVFRSNDGGQTWAKTHEGYIDDLVYTYGYYFGQIFVHPTNPDKIYTMGVPVITSNDGGKTWKSLDNSNAHSDHHALWINPKNPQHLILGNDGGINISYNDGAKWLKMNTIPVGQFYAVNVDNEKPYNIYGGLQDNGVWWASSTYKQSNDWQDDGKYPYQRIMGGDGMQVQIDSRDNTTVYTGYQFGNYFRVNKLTAENKYITPKHELGEVPYRWNWQTPILLSRHNQDILYMASHRFHRSMNKGESFETLSADLTNSPESPLTPKGGTDVNTSKTPSPLGRAGVGLSGNVPYHTITTIDESPLRFGLLYVGTDDGLVQVSKDGGYSWENIAPKSPLTPEGGKNTSKTPPSGAGGLDGLWVSRVIASKFVESRVYVSLNGYRWDNFESYVYVSENYGKTWKNISPLTPEGGINTSKTPPSGAGGLYEPVNVVREDSENANILYVGTDNGLYVSLDRGKNFMPFGNLPNVAIHDLVIQATAKEMVVGTHGRSIYIADISHLQQLDSSLLAKKLHIFPIQNTTFNENWGKPYWSKWGDINEPKTTITYFVSPSPLTPKGGTDVDASKTPPSGAGGLRITIKNSKGEIVKEITDDAEQGLNYVNYDFTTDKNLDKLKKAENGKYYLSAGDYSVEISANGVTEKQTLKIEPQKEKTKKREKKTP